jgi:hypothetical protein
MVAGDNVASARLLNSDKGLDTIKEAEPWTLHVKRLPSWHLVAQWRSAARRRNPTSNEWNEDAGTF